MYLNKLDKKQQDLFLDLCIHAAMTNEEFDREEREIINRYCSEMNITEPRYVPKKGFDEVCGELCECCSPTEIKIVVFETAALMLSDNIYDESEKRFMRTVARKLRLGREDYDTIIEYVEEAADIYAKVGKFIFGR